MEWIWSILARIGEWLIKQASTKRGKVISEIKEWQDVYLKHINFLNDTNEKKLVEQREHYEKILAYIESEKKKHPENGFELDYHKETLEYYYRLSIKINEENRDLREEIIFFKIAIDRLQVELDGLKKKHSDMYKPIKL